MWKHSKKNVIIINGHWPLHLPNFLSDQPTENSIAQGHEQWTNVTNYLKTNEKNSKFHGLETLKTFTHLWNKFKMALYKPMKGVKALEKKKLLLHEEVERAMKHWKMI